MSSKIVCSLTMPLDENFSYNTIYFAIKCFTENIFNILLCLFHCKIRINLKVFPINRKIICKIL